MKAVNIIRYGRTPKLVVGEVPALQPNKHLIRMWYAPINPSDLNFFTGTYGVRKDLPATMGFEGAGVIEDSADKQLIGKTVSVMAPNDSGTWSTHLLAPSSNLLFWDTDTNPKQVCSMFINPFTVVGMRERVKSLGFTHVLLSAAGSALARMIVQNFTRHGLTVSGMVRNPEQIPVLRKSGYKNLFLTPLTETDKTELGLWTQPVCFLDCLGGNVAGSVFNILPAKSQMINYGRLSKEPLGNIDLGELYYRDKKIEGFWLKNYMTSASAQKLHLMAKEVQSSREEFVTKIRMEVKLDDFDTGMHEAIKNASTGKVVLNCYKS